MQIDAEGEPQDREVVEPPARDVAAREELDLDIDEEEPEQLRPSTRPVLPTLGSEDEGKSGAKKSGAKKTGKKKASQKKVNPFAGESK